MSDLPFVSADDATAAIPIFALRASEWRAWADGRSAAVRAQAQLLDFRAEAGRILLVSATDGGLERVVFGLGDKPSPLLFGALARDLPQGAYRLAQAPAELPAGLVAIGWGLGAYGFDRYKARRRPPAQLVPPDGADMAEVARVVRAVWLVRDLVNTPAGDMGPAALQAAAEGVARAYGAQVEAIVGDALLAQNYPLIHAVGRAAAEPPRLVRLSWGAAEAPRLALVGKGITFDSGGLDMKASAGMRLMKKDMGGAAHALALAQLVMDAHLPVRLELLLAVAENAVSAGAFRPGDILKSRKGLSVEIDNTDAEGRLVLADALTRACEDTPSLVLDFATLTGAARTALGPDLPPLFTDDDTLAADLARAAADTYDPLWRLPLWDGYDADMDSPIADLKNTGEGAFAGAIYGGLFLRRFVTAPSWAHFDVYAWQPRDKPGKPQGGEAHALRACWALLKARYGAGG